MTDQPGDAPNPSPDPSQPPYPPQQPYGQPPYGQPQAPYGQPYPPQPYPPYAAGPYAPGPGVPGYSAYGYAVTDHPRATLGLVLGIIALAGAPFVCGLTLVIAPFAWVISHKAVREIRASQGQLGGEGQASTGRVLGIIGSVLLVVAVVLLVILVAVLVTGTSSGSDTTFAIIR